MVKRILGAGRGGRGTGLAAVIAGGAAILTVAGAGSVSASDFAPPRPAAAAALSAPAADGPAGFWYGTDSRAITISGPAPYSEPVIVSSYGGYIGMIGNWSHRLGCHGQIVWSAANSAQANVNYLTYHQGIGTGVYWFMGGPGVDPHYNGTAAQAAKWGAQQAAWVLSNLAGGPRVTYPVVFMDIEIPGHAPSYTPASDNGWNSVYTSPCGGRVRISHIPANVDRAEVNGFATYLTSRSRYQAGVYSAPDIWASIFGTGIASLIPNTYEWTYESFTSSVARRPYGWCLTGTTTCASFFGGQTSASKYALIWQWSGGGGSYNGYGDFDQIYASRTP